MDQPDLTPKAAIARLCDRQDLSAPEMAAVIGDLMDRAPEAGGATPAQIAALLLALRQKGETAEELCGAALAMRQRATPLRVPPGVVVDTCGTGGDGVGTLNISTLAALVVAACGVRVAKHGNRALSSRSGSADVLSALGVNIAATPAQVERCLAEVGIGFLFARGFHGATARVAAVRREIGVRTLFNLLGPLTNPAQVRHQVIGVPSPALLPLLGAALSRLGVDHVMLVHGHLPRHGVTLGLDEISPCGPTEVVRVRGADLTKETLSPGDFGLQPAQESDSLLGGDPAENAAQARALLGGEGAGNAAHMAVVMTAAAALHVAEGGGLPDLARRAAEAIQGGAALRVLQHLAEVSHG